MKDLRSFLDIVEKMLPDEIAHVSRQVDPNLELCAVLRKLQEQNRYPAVLFHRVKGTRFPVVANVMASRAKLALALETSPTRLKEEYAARQRQRRPPVLIEDAPVHQVVLTGDAADVTALPQIVHCAGDGGPYISLGGVVVRDPDTKVFNLGIYRVQMRSARRVGIFPGEYSHGYHILKKHEAQDRPMEVAIVVGHHPAVWLASQFRGAIDVDEFEVAGGLLGEPLRLAPAVTVDLLVPADAEMILEGRIPPHVREMEGPFGEYTWYMGGALMNPVVEVTAITMRRDPVFQDLFSAHPEHNLLGMVAREAALYEKLKQVIPSVKEVTLPFSGTCRHTAYISLRKEYDGAGKNAALVALAADAMMKWVVVVDDDIDVFNEAEVLWAVATRVQADRDVFCIPDAYVGELDPSAYAITGRHERGGLNTKWAIDATRPVGLPFQERADVPPDLWKSLRLEEYLDASRSP